MPGFSFLPKMFKVEVVVDFPSPKKPPVFRFFQEGVEKEVIEVDAYLAMITLRLAVTGLETTVPTSFSSNLQWVDGEGLPLPLPPNLGVQRQSSDCLIILDANPGSGDGSGRDSYSFIVSVVVGGRVFSSPDPTIVNKEPPVRASRRELLAMLEELESGR